MRNQAQLKLIGPFEQLLTMNNLPLKGAISDESLEVIPAAGLLVENGIIKAVSTFSKLQDTVSPEAVEVEILDEPMVCLPGFIDAHTHICYAGSRARDYAMRVAGIPYLEIAKAGGGILESVTKTRQATQQQLESTLSDRCDRHFS